MVAVNGPRMASCRSRLDRPLPEPLARPHRVALGELADELAALLVDVLGHDDLEDHEQVAGGLAAARGDALAAEPELLAAGAARGDGQRPSCPSRVGTSTLAPRTASAIVIGTSTERLRPSRREVGVRLDRRR